MEQGNQINLRFKLIKDGFAVLEKQADNLLDKANTTEPVNMEHVCRATYAHITIRLINVLFAEDRLASVNLLPEYVKALNIQFRFNIERSRRPDTFEGYPEFADVSESFMGEWLKLQTDLHFHAQEYISIPPAPFGNQILHAFDVLFILNIGDYRGVRLRLSRLFDVMNTEL